MTAARRGLAMAAASLLALGALAGSAAARTSLGNYTKVMRLLGEWRLEEARAELAGLDKADAQTPEAHVLAAHLAFLDGNYTGSLAELAAARGGGRAAPDARELQPLAQSTAAAVSGFTEQKSPSGRFIVRFQPGKDGWLVPYAFEALDAAWERIGEDLGERPAKPVLVEIYPEVAHLAKVSSLTMKEIETSGTIALCKYNRVMIVTPRALVRGYPWLDTLAHEYTHYVVTRASRDTVPIWLHEGLAKFQEQRWRSDPAALKMSRTMQHLLALALKKNRLITFEQMHPSMAKLPSQEAAATAFAEVYTAIQFLHETQGYAGIRAILAHMRDGKSDHRAIAEATGKSFEAWEASWRRWLRGRDLVLEPRLVPTELEFTDARKKRSGGGDEADLKRISEDKVRRHARLGGLLRARGRLAAAAVEYERAREVPAGKDDPFVSAKLARTYLELGRAKDAVAAAGPALDLTDDLAGPHATVGAALLADGQHAAAREHLEAALRISPFDPAVHCGLAEVFAATDDPRAAREARACKGLAAGQEP